jgi:hypothetical protein
MNDPRDWAGFATFEPEEGLRVRHPLMDEPGYWVGAPGAFYDGATSSFYLVFRWRRPRGVEPDRGAEIHVARSSDGLHFETIWRGEKTEIGSASIERCALYRPDGISWGLLISYVDSDEGQWRIDEVTADHPSEFELSARRAVLEPGALGLAGVKDPYVFRFANQYHMIVSMATARQPGERRLHETGDAFNTGLVRSATGLAVSRDGVTWEWLGEIFGPSEDGWDQYCARISCVWRQDGVWLALYDGAESVEENYEEQVGLAYSYDLRTFHRVTVDGPLMTTAQGTGAVRYFDRLSWGEQEWLYYELAGVSGSHDLRALNRPTGKN